MVHFSRRSVTGFLTSWHRKPTLCQVENHVTVGTFSSTDGTALFFADAGIGRCGIPCWGSTNGKCFYEACGGTPRNIGGILVWYVKALEALVKIKNNCFVTALIQTMYMQTQGQRPLNNKGRDFNEKILVVAPEPCPFPDGGACVCLRCRDLYGNRTGHAGRNQSRSDIRRRRDRKH